MSLEFQKRLADINASLLRENWGTAIEQLETIGTVPEEHAAMVAGVLFSLYISRNRHDKISARSAQLDPKKPKECLAALLLFRNERLGYLVTLPQRHSLEQWESAAIEHAEKGSFDAQELYLCLCFLSILDRPQHLEPLLKHYVVNGGCVNGEALEVILRCYLRHGWIKEARRLLWTQLNAYIDFARFNFLIDRVEKVPLAIPVTANKHLKFLRLTFSADFRGIPAD